LAAASALTASLSQTEQAMITMPHDLYMTAIGTAAATIAAMMLAMRISLAQRKPAVILARKWAASSPRHAVVALVPLAAIAAASFSNVMTVRPAPEEAHWMAQLLADAPQQKLPETVSAPVIERPEPSARALSALRAYADRINAKRGEIQSMAQAMSQDPAAGGDLPDVETMIARLAARLESEPGDAKGWMMLGWSYHNTGQSAQAITAYETALKLNPGDETAIKGLALAKSSVSATDAVAASGGLVGDQRDDMIRGMVNRLAARLETSPNDEEGWIRLMRSRMTLGEKDAAKSALTKALATFASDRSAQDRLTASAREFGVDVN
jgi:tetratricopeptide (TPR) repeat protein